MNFGLLYRPYTIVHELYVHKNPLIQIAELMFWGLNSLPESRPDKIYGISKYTIKLGAQVYRVVSCSR